MIRSGEKYLESLRDDREIWIDGERVRDVTRDPRFRGAAEYVAELYDLQHDAVLQDKLTYVSPDGERYSFSFIEPKTEADLVKRREMVKIWMNWTCGMMGRSPDFMNIHMTGFASGSEYFARGGERFGKNIRNYYEYMRAHDLCLTHTLINPQTDRSKPVQQQPQNTAAAIVKETDAPGLRFICRPSITPIDGKAQDYPFSSRMDEMDCVAIFDNVLVPWERVFVAQNPKLGNGMFVESGCMNQIMHQFAVKNLAKAEFLLGVALNMSEAVGINGFQHVQNYIHEMINTVELVRSCIRASEADCVPGPNGTVLPNDQPLLTVRTLFPQLYPRLVEVIQILGASGLVMVPSCEELNGARAEDVARYYQGANVQADKRIQLFRIAWDVSCSSFAGRQTLYERYFSGDPWRIAMMRYQSYPRQQELKDRVWEFARRTAEWDSRLRATNHVTA